MYVHQLNVTATEADLTSSNYVPLDGTGGSKKLPGNLLASSVVVDDIQRRTEALENTRTCSFVAGNIRETELIELLGTALLYGELILNRQGDEVSDYTFYRKSAVYVSTNSSGDNIATIVFSRNDGEKMYTATCQVNGTHPSTNYVNFEFKETNIVDLFSMAEGVTLSASEYAELEEQGKVDPNLKYYIYEDE